MARINDTDNPDPDRIPEERETIVDREEVVVDEPVVDRRSDVVGEPLVDRRRVVEGDPVLDRDTVVDRERERFGGIKFGSAFFGWLTAAGTGVILTALVSAAGAALGLGVLEDIEPTADTTETIGVVGAIAVAAIIFVAYLAGGYVAGRMARFSGAKQGIAVWLWAIIIAIIVAVIGLIAGSRFDVLATLNGLPRLPINEGSLTVVGIATAVVALLVALLGAVLGGIAGMRYHRRVDRVGFEPDREV